jgi:hypothetical protein
MIFIGLKKPQGIVIFSSSYMDTEYKNLQKNMHKRMIKFKIQSLFEDILVQLLSYLVTLKNMLPYVYSTDKIPTYTR